MSIMLKTPNEVMYELALRVKTKRLSQNLSQSGIASRSGVSLGSLKRFESTGQISLESLLKIALSLNCLKDFEDVFAQNTQVSSLFQEKPASKNRQRGLLK
ncbi:MAG: helix-turn-helix transcriptional regulator [Alphaproteobacteria bacterium]|nr:helix-turn-helix transcriptional regulator [Alphaproteobacteria bacterium]